LYLQREINTKPYLFTYLGTFSDEKFEVMPNRGDYPTSQIPKQCLGRIPKR
jgi:hypothetical protein